LVVLDDSDGGDFSDLGEEGFEGFSGGGEAHVSYEDGVGFFSGDINSGLFGSA
jgi:hypothetical protein